MKKNYMFPLYCCLIFTFILFLKTNGQIPGDIAFIAFNADGDDDLAIVTLADLTANTTIYITDNESDGIGGITSGEGTLTWFTGNTAIKAGTVIIFTDIDNSTNLNFGASIGLLSKTGSFNISSSKDGIIAFLGTDDSSPTSFIAAIQIGNEPDQLGLFDADEITLTNTSLVIGNSILVFDSSASPDGAVYNASRSSQTSYNNYYSLLIDDASNWTNVINGDGETLLPLSSEAFTINTTNWTGSESSVWNFSGNWDNGIPTSSSLATVPDAITSPIISSGTEAVVGNILIDTEGNLTINRNNSISISGLLTINGSLQMNSSSSLIVLGRSAGNITYNRTLGTTNWYLISSPVTGQGIVDFYTAEAPALGSGTGNAQKVAIALYDNSQALATDRWNYYTEGQVDGADGDDTADTFISGTGCIVKLGTSNDIAFTGTVPVDNFTTLSLTDHSGGSGNAFNLMGNPYPCYIASDETANATNNILAVNTALLTEETIWIWDQSLTGATGAYTQYNNTSGLHLAPGQGFFVSAKGVSSSFAINKNMQSHQGTDTFLRTVNRPEIHLEITNGTAVRNAHVFYIDGTTTGFDNGYDSSIFGGFSNPFAIYTHAVANGTGKNLGIQSLPNNKYENTVIPVGINAATGKEITFTTEVLNLPAGIKVFLEDRLTNTFTRLDKAKSEYKATLTETLNGVGRFYLHTAKSILSLPNLILNSVRIYKIDASTLKITGLPQGKTSFYVFDILGKEMTSTLFEANGNKEISLSKLASGIYITKIQTEKGVISKKIILESY
jgi:hypothetical protein